MTLLRALVVLTALCCASAKATSPKRPKLWQIPKLAKFAHRGANQKIVGGVDAKEGQAPWQVSVTFVFNYEGNEYEFHLCGG